MGLYAKHLDVGCRLILFWDTNDSCRIVGHQHCRNRISCNNALSFQQVLKDIFISNKAWVGLQNCLITFCVPVRYRSSILVLGLSSIFILVSRVVVGILHCTPWGIFSADSFFHNGGFIEAEHRFLGLETFSEIFLEAVHHLVFVKFYR